MTDTSIPVVSDPVVSGPVVAEPVAVSTGTAIVASPTTIAPLISADGTAYIVQVMNPGNGTITPMNAATWSENASGGLDVCDANGNLVASFASGSWTSVQLVQAP